MLWLLLACAPYRSYPLLQFDAGQGRDGLELTGLARLGDGQVVVTAEGDADALYSPVSGDGSHGLSPGSGVLEVFPLVDGRGICPERRCERGYRARVRLRPWPIQWQGDAKRLPFNLSDITAFGEEALLAVTEYSTVGRRTGARRDYLVRSRQRTERLVLLTRQDGYWKEEIDPELNQLQALLSDWGRGSCADDMLVEGLAWDPGEAVVYIGLRRCEGPRAQVLRYALGQAREGRAADVEVAASGVSGGVGPEEGVSALSFAAGRLWALTAWDSYGYATEPAWGGRLHEVRDGTLVPVDLPGPFVDRPSGLAVVDGSADLPFSALEATVVFDPDDALDENLRPSITVLHPRTPKPGQGAYIGLVDQQALPEPLALGLNGFDFRWYARDHRLSQMALLLERLPGRPPGAWTRSLGGFWQGVIGSALGLTSASLPGRPKWAGHNRQAVALTDYAAVPGLEMRRYRAVLSVLPRERERRDPSVASLLRTIRDDYALHLPRPEGVPEEAGVILQGFSIDTGSRADRGICLAAMDLGVDRAPGEVVLRAMLVGGLCNDFDFRGPDLRHGVTTDVEGGVEVVLHYALVWGVPTRSWSVSIEDREVPAPAERPLRGPREMNDKASRAHLHCARVGEGVELLPRPEPSPPTDWLDVATELRGEVGTSSASLHGFAFAFDPVGFAENPGQPRTDADVLRRNQYIYRYLVRAFGGPDGAFVEGGFTHGIHRRGPMKDSAPPTALYLRTDLTAIDAPGAVGWDMPREGADPNLLPEDGFIRWAVTRPVGPLTCSPAF